VNREHKIHVTDMQLSSGPTPFPQAPTQMNKKEGKKERKIQIVSSGAVIVHNKQHPSLYFIVCCDERACVVVPCRRPRHQFLRLSMSDQITYQMTAFFVVND
jgi:hypothetical protein